MMKRVPNSEKNASTCSAIPLVGYTIRHTSVIWIAFTFVLILLLPLTQLLNDPGLSNSRAIYLGAPFEIGRMLVIPVCMLMAIRAFDYLTKEKETTFFHSLPYSRTKIFVVNALTGFALIVVPLLFVCLAAVLVSLIQGTGIVIYYFALYGVLCSECFYVYAFSILMVMLFSNKGSLFPMTAILFCYTEIMFFIINITVNNLMSIIDLVRPSTAGLLFLSPLRVCFTAGLRYDSIPVINRFGGFSFTDLDKVLITEIISGVIMTILAYILYRKRKSESSGEVVAFKSCRYIFKWGFSLSLALFMTMLFGITSVYGIKDSTTKNIIICSIFIAFSLILYIIAEMIVSKKFNIFKKVSLQLVPLFAVTLLLSVLTVTDTFGIKDYVPHPDDVKYLTVKIENQSNSIVLNEFNAFEYLGVPNITEYTEIQINSEPGDIGIKNAFINLHKRIVSEKPGIEISNKEIEFIYYDQNLQIYDSVYMIPEEYLYPLKHYIDQRSDEKYSYRVYKDESALLQPTYFLRRFISFVLT